ncbi:granzyme E-like [Alligator sinensis]|uniref:Granzyme E-like n=1 Tax=Alligator sinensis TaxID=38654 RepID=A0A3Q0FVC1_ALLSI|nr:granzyme E-like [Alligator sinensis]
MALLKIRSENYNGECGGFLVSKNFVITAAHCGKGRNITVYLGAHNLNKKEKSQQWIRVQKMFPHKKYNKMTLENDILLLQLQHKARLTKAVKPIRLPKPRCRVKKGTICNVAGWGDTSVKSHFPPATLQQVDLRVNDTACQKRFAREYDPCTMMCADDPQGLKTPFKGDSGGPLVCD